MSDKQPKTVPAGSPVAKKATAPKPVAPAAVQAMSAPAAIAAATVETPVVKADVAPPSPAAQPASAQPKGKTMTDTVNATETVKNFAQDAQNKASAMFSDWNGRTKAAVERSTKLVEDMNEFNKGNIEAVVESSRLAAKAAEQMGRDAAETARKNFEQATAALKSLASVKTPTEFMQLQSDYARSAFDQLIAETSKNSEMVLKLAGDIFQPISNRFAVAAEKIKIAA